MLRRLQAVAMAALLLVMTACAEAPETGRSQLMIVGEQQAQELGFQTFEKLKEEKQISRDARMNRAVQEVGRRIANVSPNPDWEWEFVVFEDDTPNAFALPGGKVGVNTGLFKVARTDAQLAAVVGHEVAHAIAQHGAERMSQQLGTQVAVQGASILAVLFGYDPGLVQAGQQVASVGLPVFITLPHSRLQESEADEIGLYYMARAGYDPRGAVELWQNMAEAGGGAPVEFLSTHPSHGNRIARLEELMPRAMEEYQG